MEFLPHGSQQESGRAGALGTWRRACGGAASPTSCGPPVLWPPAAAVTLIRRPDAQAEALESAHHSSL